MKEDEKIPLDDFKKELEEINDELISEIDNLEDINSEIAKLKQNFDFEFDKLITKIKIISSRLYNNVENSKEFINEITIDNLTLKTEEEIEEEKMESILGKLREKHLKYN